MCTETQKKLCNDDNCSICYDRSFASHPRAKNWSERNNIKPRQIFKGTHIKYFFNCPVCFHIFDKEVYTVAQGKWCKFCASKELCNSLDCQYCYEKSFLSHSQSQYWSKKNELTPRQVMKNSNKKYFFDCNICFHVFSMHLHNINQNKAWCPYCSSSPKYLCENNDCSYCYNKSFISHKKAKYWSTKNTISPRQVFKGTNKKYWFRCEHYHEFNIQLNHINRGYWCRFCKNKTEIKLLEWLNTYINLTIKYQVKFNWCRSPETDWYYRFDFVINEYKLIIELDGMQHFTQVSNWQSPEDTHKKDLYKMDKANEHGYTVLRLLQEDVHYDKMNWQDQLLQNIKRYPFSTRIYICQNNEYDMW